MKNILFVCAMEKEGKQIAEELGMSEVSSNLFSTDDKMEKLLISGIGKQCTAINLTKFLCENQKPDLIVNIGYAGSTDIKIGKWVNISRVYNYEWEIPGEEKYVMLVGGSQELVELKNSDNNNIFETVECYSSESFVTQTDINDHVSFDMELHSISLVCDLYNIPLVSLKKISDNLSLDNYYEMLNQDNVFELTSFLKYKIDGVCLLDKIHNLE